MDIFIKPRQRRDVAVLFKGIGLYDSFWVCLEITSVVALSSSPAPLLGGPFRFRIVILAWFLVVGFIPHRIILGCKVVRLPVVLTISEDGPSFLHFAHVFVFYAPWCLAPRFQGQTSCVKIDPYGPCMLSDGLRLRTRD